ncbi:carbonate dehydratase [Oscillatoria laete-virens NRMC-F 0139]|nr:carbonate dehydratase [Oscillatoria laete-virens]MDL5053615.1 carbonate dehydratase [Oscillatoria laete-virens NRMC-F 0139]
MDSLEHLFESNRKWAEAVTQRHPGFFEELSRQQSPQYLWIGCADSRVPANEIVDLLPGELFVHRNIANVVCHSDLNCLSVVQFAVDLLKVRHIIVCGHYGCSGVHIVGRGDRVGLSDNWLRHINDVRHKHHRLLSDCKTQTERMNRLCELNVIEQVVNLSETTTVQDAWMRGQELTLHGWIYGLKDGLLKDLGMTLHDASDIAAITGRALEKLGVSGGH